MKKLAFLQCRTTRATSNKDRSWDAFVSVPDPDALAAEFASRNVEFFLPLHDNNNDGLRGFELKDADGYLLILRSSPQINTPSHSIRYDLACDVFASAATKVGVAILRRWRTLS
jgi:hypothetical protein